MTRRSFISRTGQELFELGSGIDGPFSSVPRVFTKR
jgi:hypothetical protein